MSNVVELVRRAERLRDQAELLRQQIDELRHDLQLLGAETHAPSAEKQSCLAVAIALSQDLGPEFSSEQPHDLAGRGDDWSVDRIRYSASIF